MPSFQHARRLLRGFAYALLFAASTLLPRIAAAQSADDGFSAYADNQVLGVTIQPDGKSVAVGRFNQIDAQTYDFIVRLNADGSPDTTFGAGTNGLVLKSALQPDGKMIVAGCFTQVDGQSVPRGLARINSNGSLDNTFVVAGDANGCINALAIQADGKVIIGGAFTSIGGQARNRIARLNADGSLDTTFDPNADSYIYDMTLQPDGKLVVGGNFTSFMPNGAMTSVTRNYVARLNSDGTVDTSFVDSGADKPVNAVALQPDGQVLAGGTFTQVGGQTRNYIARLGTDGSLDTTYDPDADNAVNTLVMQPDGKVVAGGAFTSFMPNGAMTSVTRHYVARLNTDGTVDTSFIDPNADNTVRAVGVQPDGRLIIGGDFANVGGQAHAYLARLEPDGSLDNTLDRNPSASIDALAVQADNSLIVGGLFTQLDGHSISRIARLAPDGSLDASYNPNADNTVMAFAAQADGTLVVGGAFTHMGGDAHNYIAKLGPDGTANGAYGGSADNSVAALATQTDGNLVVGGLFTHVDGQPSNHIARLKPDGTLDGSFTADVDSTVLAVAEQPDGKLVVGGLFTHIDSTARNYIARLNADGSLDGTFDPDADNYVNAVKVQPDGKIVVGGTFNTLDPNGSGIVNRNHIARLDADGGVDGTFNPDADGDIYAVELQPNGKLVIGGAFTQIGSTSRTYIARLNADGSLDSSFNPTVTGGDVFALSEQTDGKLVVSGAFTGIDALTRNYIARLSTSQAAVQSLTAIGYTAGGNVVTWTRTGGGPALAEPPNLYYSTDGVSYGAPDSMQQVGGGWGYTGIALPLGQVIYLRAKGMLSSGQYDGSGGITQSTREFYLSSNDGIFHNGFN